MGKLEEYRRKRRFDRTPEPSGEPDVGEVEVPRAKERRFLASLGMTGRRKAGLTQGGQAHTTAEAVGGA